MKKILIMLVVLAIGTAAQASMTANWSFESNLSDTATGGTTSDTLVGMRYYGGNGTYDRSVTSYNADGTTETLTTAVTAATYEKGIVGTAVRIGTTGSYNYATGATYPNASTYCVPSSTSGATYLSSTGDSADLSLGSEFTVEGFFKADDLGTLGVEDSGLGEFAYTRLITKWVSGFSQGYHFTIHNGALELIEKNSSSGAVTTAGSVSVVADRWFYVSAVADGENISIYFYTTDDNGDLVGGLVATGAYNGTILDSTSPLWIGGRADVPNPISSNNVFVGLVDEVRLWDEAVDDTYIASRAALLVPEPMTLVILGLGGLLIRKK